MRYAALEPALVLLSTLSSFPFAIYCARFIGGRALRIVRNDRHAIIGVGLNPTWATLLFRFVAGSAIAYCAVIFFDYLFSLPTVSIANVGSEVDVALGFANAHGVFAAVLVANIWPHTTTFVNRLLLLAYLSAIAAALVATGSHDFAAVVAAYAIGVGAAFTAIRLLRPQA